MSMPMSMEYKKHMAEGRKGSHGRGFKMFSESEYMSEFEHHGREHHNASVNHHKHHKNDSYMCHGMVKEKYNER